MIHNLINAKQAQELLGIGEHKFNRLVREEYDGFEQFIVKGRKKPLYSKERLLLAKEQRIDGKYLQFITYTISSS